MSMRHHIRVLRAVSRQLDERSNELLAVGVPTTDPLQGYFVGLGLSLERAANELQNEEDALAAKVK
jgi:hypothetical protein